LTNSKNNQKNSSKIENNSVESPERSELRKFLLKIIPFIKGIKNSPSMSPVYFFFYAYGFTFLLSLILFEIPSSIQIPFFFAETGESVIFNFPMGDLISVIIFGGVFSLSSLRAFELLREKIDPIKKRYEKRLFVVILYVFFMILLILGVLSHMIANQLNSYIHEIETEQIIIPNTPLGHLKSGIYLWDELISHILIGLGFYGMLYVNSYLDLNSDGEKIRPIELFSIISAAVLIGAGTSLGFIEGQSGLIFLFFSVFLIFAIITIIKKNDLSYRKNPFVLCGLIMCVTYIITTVIFISFTGLKSYYPFFFQLSELGF
jgi:hypothetical protein